MLRVRVDLDMQRPLIRLSTSSGITLVHHGASHSPVSDCGLGGWTFPCLLTPRRDNPSALAGGDGRQHWVRERRKLPERLLNSLALAPSSLMRRPLTLYDSPTAGLVIFNADMQHVATRHGIVQSAGVDLTYDGRGWPAMVFTRLDSLVLERAGGPTTLRGRGGPIVLSGIDDSTVQIVRLDDRVLELAYGGHDQLTSLRDVASERTWRFEYDDNGRLVTLLYPSGAARHVRRIDEGDGYSVTSMVDFDRERRIDVRRDALGRAVRVSRCCGAPPATSTTSSRRPDVVVQLPDGSVWRRRVRSDGSTKQVRLVTPGKISTEVRASGSLDLDLRGDPRAPRHRRVESGATAVDYHYDPVRRELTVGVPEGCTWRLRFDENGRAIAGAHDGFAALEACYAAGDGETVVVRVPSTGRPGSPSPPAAQPEVVLRATTVDGSVERLLDARAHLLLRVDRETSTDGAAVPPGVAILTCKRHPKVVPMAVQMPTGRTRAVDEIGHYPFDGELGDGVPRPEIARDANGRVSSLRFGDLEWTFEREPWPGRIVRAQTDGIVQRRRYDGPLLVEDETQAPVPTRLRATYGEGFHLRSLTLNGADPLVFTWDGGRPRRIGPVELDLPPCPHLGVSRVSIGAMSVSETRGSDAHQRQVTYSGQVIATQAYRYDASGRLTTYGEAGTVLGDSTVTYGYAPGGMVCDVRDNGITESVRYDPDGVVRGIARRQGNVTVQSDALGRVTRHGDLRCRWDGHGRMVGLHGASEQTFEYDDRGQLRATVRDGRRVEFQYDYRGRLIGRSGEGGVRRYALDDRGRVLGVVDATGAVVAEYVYASRNYAPDAIRLGQRWCVAILGPSESVRALVDAATGEVVEQRRYGAWGEPRHHIAPAQPLGYACGIEEPDWGLVWFGSRWYAPSIGMWLTADQLGVWSGDPNLHRYVRNDPVNYVDRTGRWGFWIGVSAEAQFFGGVSISGGFGWSEGRGWGDYTDYSVRSGPEVSAGIGIGGGVYEETDAPTTPFDWNTRKSSTGVGFTTPAGSGDWYIDPATGPGDVVRGPDYFTGFDVSFGPTFGGGVHVNVPPEVDRGPPGGGACYPDDGITKNYGEGYESMDGGVPPPPPDEPRPDPYRPPPRHRPAPPPPAPWPPGWEDYGPPAP